MFTLILFFIVLMLIVSASHNAAETKKLKKATAGLSPAKPNPSPKSTGPTIVGTLIALVMLLGILYAAFAA